MPDRPADRVASATLTPAAALLSAPVLTESVVAGRPGAALTLTNPAPCNRTEIVDGGTPVTDDISLKLRPDTTLLGLLKR